MTIPSRPSGIEKRRFKRYPSDISLHIQGIDKNGNKVEEDSFALNISRCGVCFVSSVEYNPKEKLTINFHLSFSLGKDIDSGDFMVKGRIVRIDKVLRTPTGLLKSQNIAVNFDIPLGVQKAKDPWAQTLD